MKTFRIDLLIYKTFILFYISDNFKECQNHFNNKYKKSNLIDIKDEPWACCFNRGFQVIFLLEKNLYLSLIIHEILHAVFGIFRNRDIVYSEDSEEAYTYLCDYILNEFTKKINKLKDNFILKYLIEK